MESAERRKLNRLLRRAAPPFMNRSGSNALKQIRSTIRVAPRHNRPHTSPSTVTAINAKETERHGIAVDVAKLCAEMCGVSNLPASGVGLLQKHLNQLTHLLVHAILRVMEQSRRGIPQTADVDMASLIVGLEAPFSTTLANFLPIRTGGRTATSGLGGKVFFIRPDKEIDVKALLLREPAGVVYDVSLVAHWLAVGGKQPISPQNPPPDFLLRMQPLNGSICGVISDSISSAGSLYASDINDPYKHYWQVAAKETKDQSVAVNMEHPRNVSSLVIDRRLHEVSQEVMIYFRELTEACVGASENRRHEALDNATLDPGLQPILPHLVTFIAEGVRVNVTNHNLAILIYLMRLVKALVDNSHISLEPYLHVLVPTVTTCVLNRQLCAKPITDNHWALRDFAAKQLVTLCNRHNTSTNELYTRVTRELSRALYCWIEGVHSAGSAGEHEVTDILKSHHSNSVSCIVKSDSLSGRVPTLGTSIHSMNTLYGILVALAEFGAQTLRIMVFPVLPALCHRLTKILEPPMIDATEPHVSFAAPTRLSPADQRSYEFLKVMLSNRISVLLADWRSRQNLGISLEDYQTTYEALATCLYNSRGASTALPGATTNCLFHIQQQKSTTGSTTTTSTRQSLVTTSNVTAGPVTKQECLGRLLTTSTAYE